MKVYILLLVLFLTKTSFGQLSWSKGNIVIDVDFLDFGTIEQKDRFWVVRSKDVVIKCKIESETYLLLDDNAIRNNINWGRDELSKYVRYAKKKNYILNEIKDEKWSNSNFICNWSYKALAKNYLGNSLKDNIFVAYYAGVDKNTDTGYSFVIYSNSIKKIEEIENKIRLEKP